MFITSALALSLALNSDCNLNNAKDLALKDNYEEAGKLLLLVSPSPSTYNDYNYYSLLIHYRLNQKEKALADLVGVYGSFKSYPRRHQAMIYLISEDLKIWTDDGLDDIERDMLNSLDRLMTLNAENKTQKIQKDIIDKLDRFIKQQEDKQNQANGQGKKDDPNSQPMDGQGSGDQPLNPADDSKIMGGKGPGKIDDKVLRKYTENWGSLPPQERQKIVNQVYADLPIKYRPMIDEYFKSLNKLHGK